jgi:hypothetical protein
MIKLPRTLLLLLCVAAPALAAESKFTLETVKGKMTASWSGPADPTALDAAPTDGDIAGLAAFPDIKVVTMSGATNMTGSGFAALKKNAKLRVTGF